MAADWVEKYLYERKVTIVRGIHSRIVPDSF